MKPGTTLANYTGIRTPPPWTSGIAANMTLDRRDRPEGHQQT